jgi:hypothetical protein
MVAATNIKNDFPSITQQTPHSTQLACETAHASLA